MHIDRLGLRGVRPEDRRVIAEGLRAEVAGMLSEPTAAAGLGKFGAIARLRAGKVAVAPGTTPHAVGAGVGRRLAQAIRS